jgi:predicted nucleotidyltransferase
MTKGFVFDRDEVGRVCRQHHVIRLRIFGSATTDAFDPARSDVDLLVEFEPERKDAFGDYFGLKEDLEALFGRSVDLVMESAIRNPYFASSAAAHAESLYAA